MCVCICAMFQVYGLCVCVLLPFPADIVPCFPPPHFAAAVVFPIRPPALQSCTHLLSTAQHRGRLAPSLTQHPWWICHEILLLAYERAERVLSRLGA